MPEAMNQALSNGRASVSSSPPRPPRLQRVIRRFRGNKGERKTRERGEKMAAAESGRRVSLRFLWDRSRFLFVWLGWGSFNSFI